MLQFVKWTILSLLFVLFLPDHQVKSEIEKIGEESVCPATNGYGNLQNPNLFTLFNTSGDLTVDISHNTYDKKTFIRLLLHPRYSKIHPPLHGSTLEPFSIPFLDKPESKDYYVYTLEKILI